MAAATAGQDGAPVAVQITTIVPVRVFSPHGEYFDTEVDIDTPLRALQLAIEDYFKVKPEVQLLLHNRQQIRTERSLRDNGCLLLKGDPYIKIVCAIKRGPVLNLLCEVGQLTYVVACHESSTVWEVKKMLCEEMARQQQPAREDSGAERRPTYGPERLRLLWRYMELNDRATLHYYRVPTNAVFQVMHRKRAVAAPSGAAVSTAAPPATPSASAANSMPTSQGRPLAPPTVWWQRPPAPQGPSYPPQPSASPTHSPAEYNADFEYLTRRAAPPEEVVAPAMAPSVSFPAPPPPPAAYVPAYPPAVHTGLAPSVAAGPPSPPQHQHYDPLTSSEAVGLALRVGALEEQLRALWRALQEQQQAGEYQRGSLADTHQRILELQEQMSHVLWLQQETARLIVPS
ncbi:hypothetical protein ABB37_08534 [Leptomonas pyrrhocoris]|uniref:Ubiquitin-like domain-containing protein n=1 Tax=Leptomonas pyrrhocoris TaxID=157538 RepID=A0A0M9FST7_LEPPY|nr:hypothetical protein ABB37_08534 [Leptomonas pyrrhocoris]KPA75219.1 hypothetical protein ABB37_08534 [Leptomonas pyrrhocoris]|eukprot:XP_015653658.1 hypothetical protein ABB37_08534 [Leptomonas pyrrhocoris]